MPSLPVDGTENRGCGRIDGVEDDGEEKMESGLPYASSIQQSSDSQSEA